MIKLSVLLSLAPHLPIGALCAQLAAANDAGVSMPRDAAVVRSMGDHRTGWTHGTLPFTRELGSRGKAERKAGAVQRLPA